MPRTRQLHRTSRRVELVMTTLAFTNTEPAGSARWARLLLVVSTASHNERIECFVALFETLAVLPECPMRFEEPLRFWTASEFVESPRLVECKFGADLLAPFGQGDSSLELLECVREVADAEVRHTEQVNGLVVVRLEIELLLEQIDHLVRAGGTFVVKGSCLCVEVLPFRLIR